jgi:hypothetical protein
MVFLVGSGLRVGSGLHYSGSITMITILSISTVFNYTTALVGRYLVTIPIIVLIDNRVPIDKISF